MSQRRSVLCVGGPKDFGEVFIEPGQTELSVGQRFGVAPVCNTHGFEPVSGRFLNPHEPGKYRLRAVEFNAESVLIFIWHDLTEEQAVQRMHDYESILDRVANS